MGKACKMCKKNNDHLEKMGIFWTFLDQVCEKNYDWLR